MCEAHVCGIGFLGGFEFLVWAFDCRILGSAFKVGVVLGRQLRV